MSQPAMAPPQGVVANMEHPTDVLRTINFATQALTLALCSLFVFIRGAQTFVVDDCGCPRMAGGRKRNRGDYD
jgi:hypothetical protein